jgi:integrase
MNKTTWQKTKDRRIKKRGDVYWARFMKRGHHVQQSLETSSFEIAKRAVENIEGDILLGVNWKKEKELFETAWPEFLEDKAKGIKTKKARPKTFKEYVGFGERFYKPNFNHLRLSQINEEAWSDLVDQIRKEKPGMQFDNVRKYLMGFLSWAYRKGKIRVKPELFDPDVDIKAERDHDGPGLAYSLEQLKVMREIAREQSDRFYTFMLMMQYMGMRPGEITQLKRDRVDFGERVIRLRKADTKTAQARVVPIHTKVLLRIEHMMGLTEGSDYLFVNANDFKRPMDPQGFKKYWAEILAHPLIAGRVYDMRHTFITHAIKQGMNPAAVAKMTGTSLRMIERRYLHLTSEDLGQEISKFEL